MLIGQHTSFGYCILAVFLGIVMLDVAHAVQAGQRGTLTLGIHPYLPEKEIIKKFSPLSQHLSGVLNESIEIRIAKNYESQIERIGNDSLDIAFMGPASYVEMTQLHGKYPLLGRLSVNGSPTFHGAIIVRADSPFNTLADLKNKRFAFGSVKSTMSYLVPRRMLFEAGVPLEKLEGYSFLGNHRNVVLGVLVGEYHAGAVKEAVYENFRAKGLRLLALSPPVSEHVFVANRKLPEQRLNILRKAMYELSDNESGRKVLKKIKNGVTAIVPATDKDYDSLRQLLSNPQDK